MLLDVHRYLFLKLHELLQALLLNGIGDDIGQVLCGIGAVFLTIGKRAHALEACLAHKVEKLLEFLVALAREAHHEGGAQMQIGHLTAQPVDERQGLGLGDVPAHVGEHFIADVLQGYVEIAAHIRMLRHDGQYVVRELGGVGVVEANPLDTVDGSHLLNKFGQGKTAIEVFAVRREVLRNHIEFLHALGCE